MKLSNIVLTSEEFTAIIFENVEMEQFLPLASLVALRNVKSRSFEWKLGQNFDQWTKNAP